MPTSPISDSDRIHPTVEELSTLLAFINDDEVRREGTALIKQLLSQRNALLTSVRQATKLLREINEKGPDISLALKLLAFEANALRIERDEARAILDSHGIKWQK